MHVSSFDLRLAEEPRSVSRQKSGERESPTKKLIRFKQEKAASRRATGGFDSTIECYGANSKLSSIEEKENTDSPKREGGFDASRESLGARENLPNHLSMN